MAKIHVRTLDEIHDAICSGDTEIELIWPADGIRPKSKWDSVDKCVQIAFALAKSSLTSLKLRNVARGSPEELLPALARAIVHSPTLKHFLISLGDNFNCREYYCRSCLAVAEALESNQVLRSFTLTRFSDELADNAALSFLWNTKGMTSCTVNTKYLGNDGGELNLRFAKLLEQNPTLKSFDYRFFCEHINDKCGVILAQAIEQHMTLESFQFDARGSQSGNATGIAIANAVKTVPRLQFFGFASSERMDDDTGLCVAEVMKSHTELTSLSFRASSIMSNTVGEAIADAAGSKPCLRHLEFSCGSRMDDEVGLCMADVISRSHVLEHVVFRASHRMGNTTGEAMADALKCSSELQSVTLWLSEAMSAKIHAACADAVRNHRVLHTFYCTTGCLAGFYNLGYNDDDDDVVDPPEAAFAAAQQAFFANVTLTRIDWFTQGEAFTDITERNRTIREQARAIAATSHGIERAAFCSLKDKGFRAALFKYFLPPQCKLMPADFLWREQAATSAETISKHGLADRRSYSAQASSSPPHSSVESAAVVAPLDPAAGATDKDKETVAGANSDIAMALIRSKLDVPPCLNADGAVLFRLDAHARAIEVANAIREAPALADCRATVEAAGCNLRPEWANGAWILLPLTYELYTEADLELNEIHILALSQDEAAVREALKTVKYKKRPKLKAVEAVEAPDGASQVSQAGSSSGHSEPRDLFTNAGDEDMDIVVKCTFLECRPKLGKSSGYQSAPAVLSRAN